ncbi:MAG TPA: S9 family peptidase [Planctomycetota bacterium]|nr:S9 family peptidase [Planctomycetota bacterium]
MEIARVRTFVLFASLAAAAAAQEATKPRLTAEDVITAPRLSDPQISPDGKVVLYAVGEPSLAENKVVTRLWTVPVEGGAAKRLTEGPANEGRWSPDGSKIAYVARAADGPQIFVMNADGGGARQVTKLSTGASGPAWSPDGARILFTSEVRPGLKDDDAQRAKAKEIEDSGVKAQIFDGLLFRHWSSFSDGKRSQLFTVDVASGAVRQLTDEARHAPPFNLGGPPDYAWSRDGKSVYFTRGPAAEVEAWSTNADLCVVSAEGGTPRNLTPHNLGWDGSPSVSPDGRWVAFRSQARDGYESDLYRLMLLNVETGAIRRVAGALNDGVDEMLWKPESDGLFVSTQEEGSHAWWETELGAFAASKIFSGPNAYSASLGPDGRTFVALHATLTRPPELYRFDGAGFTRLTFHQKELLEGRAWPTRESRVWTGAGQEKVHGFVTFPPDFDDAKRWPLLLLIHGGPQGAWMDGWSTRWNPAIFASAGYVVFSPNPRGSTGYGHRFVEQISRDWGGRVMEDVLNGVDALVAEGYVDPSRMGAAGGSYGGYLVNWILGHDHRFKALMSHAGVYDLVSMYGSTEELWFPEWEFGGPPWEQPEHYERWSPHRYAAAFRTPTLVIHGELDYRVPVAQGLQLFSTLQRKGVPSRFLYFPDEGHWILKPKNSRLWNATVLEWFDGKLKPAK